MFIYLYFVLIKNVYAPLPTSSILFITKINFGNLSKILLRLKVLKKWNPNV